MWIEWRKPGSISPKIRNKTTTLTHTTRNQHNIGIPSRSSPTTRRNKIKPDWKEVKLPLFTDDNMIVNLENPKGPTKKQLEMIMNVNNSW